MVPDGWGVSALQEVGPIIDCKHRTPTYVGNGIPIVSPGNLRWGALSFETCRRVSSKDHVSLMDHCTVEIGDIVYGRNQSVGVGSRVVCDQPFALGQDTVLIKPKRIDPRFLYEQLQSSLVLRQIKKLSGGSTFSRINLGEIRKLIVTVPPLPEQKKIAEILSTWDAAIETAEKLLANAETQKRALMQPLLAGKRRLKGFEGREWIRRTLGELGEPYGGLSGKSAGDFGQGKPFITYMTVFSRSRVDVNAMQFVEIGPKEKQHRVRKGDIFFTVSSETPDEVGMSSVLLDDVGEAYLNSFCFGYRLNSLKTLRPEYARYLLRGSQFRRDIRKLAQGATRYNLSKRQLMHLYVELPSFEEQEQIVGILDAEDDRVEAYRKDIEMLRSEKRALMQQLMTGMRRVTV